ncbi:hypothetical protein JCM5350_008015 [Sporobolomyces pararoseus]
MSSSDPMRSNPSSISRLSQVTRHLESPSSNSSLSPPPLKTKTKKQPRRSIAPPPKSKSFVYWLPFQSRWSDNDQYSHFNNVVYSQYFDSITNEFLINQCGMNQEDPIGLIVHSETNFNSQLTYPEPVLAGLAITSLSSRKIVWKLGLFKAEYLPQEEGTEEEEEGSNKKKSGEFVRKVRIARTSTEKGEGEEEEVRAAAWGTMTHVFVERGGREKGEKNKVVESLPKRWQEKLQSLVIHVNEGEK